MLENFEMESYKPVSIPMIIGCKLSNKDELEEINQTLYRFLIGILLYVTTTRLDIMHEVGLVARFKVVQRKHMCR